MSAADPSDASTPTPTPAPGAGVDAVELVRVVLPLRTPLRSAHGTEAARDVVMVRAVGHDGVEGWGECSALGRPTYTGEYTEAAWHLLRREVVPAVLARREPSVRGHPMALAALRTAVLDLELRRRGVALADHLDGSRRSVTSCAVIGVTGSAADLEAAVAAAVAAGHGHLKLKVSPRWLREPLRLVRSGWPAIGLAADANGSFAPDEHGQLAAVDDLDLAYLEQPHAPDALVETAETARRLATPIALDESIGSVGAARAALALGAARVLNVKPARVGGVVQAAEIARLVAAEGARAFVGGMLETGVGRATALGVCSLEACALPTDLGPSARYFARDVTAERRLQDGALAVPDGPGIGVVPEPQALRDLAVQRLVLRR